MSRAFVKQAEDGAEELPDRPVSVTTNVVTPRWLAAIDASLAPFVAPTAKRVPMTTRAPPPRPAGSPPLAGAAGERGRRPSALRAVSFGTEITLRRDAGREQTFPIVAEDEADPARGTISYVSPLTVLTCGPGDVVENNGCQGLRYTGRAIAQQKSNVYARRVPSAARCASGTAASLREFGNRATICRKCYVHPELLNSYMHGNLVLEVKSNRANCARMFRAFKPEKATVLLLMRGRLAKEAERAAAKRQRAKAA